MIEWKKGNKKRRGGKAFNPNGLLTGLIKYPIQVAENSSIANMPTYASSTQCGRRPLNPSISDYLVSMEQIRVPLKKIHW
jgi:hypothetical protein